MQIFVDDEARVVVEKMCDVSLKVGGLQNMPTVLSVLHNLKALSEKEVISENQKTPLLEKVKK